MRLHGFKITGFLYWLILQVRGIGMKLKLHSSKQTTKVPQRRARHPTKIFILILLYPSLTHPHPYLLIEYPISEISNSYLTPSSRLSHCSPWNCP